MTHPSFRTASYLVLDAFLIIVCLAHIPFIVERPGAPFEIVKDDAKVKVSAILDSVACPGVRVGDALTAWGGKPVIFPEMVEYLADVSPIGTEVQLSLQRNGRDLSAAIRLISFYLSFRFLVICVFVGLTIFAVGIFILLSRPSDIAARTLHWALITLATTIMITWGLARPGALETYLARIIWFVTYLGVAVSFFFFTLVFPRERIRLPDRYSWLLLLAVFILGSAFAFSHLSALSSGSAEAIATFQSFLDLFHGSLFVFIGGGLFNLARATVKASNDEERRKMYWILWGLSIGALPYLVVHILPQLLLSRTLVSEEFTTIFFLAIPTGFAIALLKYRLFDVQLVISRTIVYGVLSFVILAGYALLVLLVASGIEGEQVFQRYLAVAAITMVLGLLINPLRLRLQHIVDEILFAARANFRRSLTSVVESLHQALDTEELYSRLVRAVHDVVPSETIAIYGVVDGGLTLQASQGPEPCARIALDERIGAKLSSGTVLTRKGAVRDVQPSVDLSGEDWLRDARWSVCAPMVSQGKELLGVLALNPRLAREHYAIEEINFLTSVTEQAAESLERLTLQKKIILAQAEQKRSEELSALKSYFISSVTHELRMPLTSIRMFAEMLEDGSVRTPRRRREYLEIIKGESERLSRLISNVLDFAKIERGAKEYAFEPVKIEDVVHRSVNAMRYQFLKHEGKLRVKVQKGLPLIEADGDALEETLMNLLSNALKYSTIRKEVQITVSRKRQKVVITVSDKGIGIHESQLCNIFEPFYRVREDQTRQIGGAGLGLAVVKHIVDAHGGTISVQSEVGKGSQFTLQLPLSRQHRRNTQ